MNRFFKQTLRPRLLAATLAALTLSGCVKISDPIVSPRGALLPEPTAVEGSDMMIAPPLVVDEEPLTATLPITETETEVVDPAPRADRLSPTRTPTVTPTPVVYTVQQGDTLGGIAAGHGVTTEALKAANGLLDADRLAIGQMLIIPSAGGDVAVALAATPTAILPKDDAGHIVHFVKAGETLSAIASLYGVPREDILFANGLRPDSQLTAGDTIIVPQGAYTTMPTATALPATLVPTLVVELDLSRTPTPAAESATPVATAVAITHVVQPGEVAGVIARDNGVTVPALAAANPGVNMDRLSIGQTLVIPASAEAVAVAIPEGTPTPVTITVTPTRTPTPNAVLATHVAHEGDTWANLSELYGVPETTLQGYNPTLTSTIPISSVVQIPLGTPTPTATPTALPTLTPTPAPAFIAPQPLLPADGSSWNHWDNKQALQLIWASSGILADDEFYVVRLRALDVEDPNVLLWSKTHWTQTPNWRLPEEILTSVRGSARLRWDVMVMRRTSPESAETWTGEVLSEKSVTFEIQYTYSGS